MKIVILDGHAVNPGDLSWDFLNQYGDVTVFERTSVDQVAERIGDASIVLTNKSPITEEILEASEEKPHLVLSDAGEIRDTLQNL